MLSFLAAAAGMASTGERPPPAPQPLQPYGIDAGIDTSTYHAWLERNAVRWQAEDDVRLSGLLAMASPPTISVLVPVYRPDPGHLRHCLHSVLDQTWPGWELCVVDDRSDEPETATVLEELERLGDPRVRVLRSERNGGISHATNEAARAATGAHLAFLDHDDVLEPTVLGQVASALRDAPRCDVLYTDQDILSPGGERIEPYFKSGWNPDLLLSNMYLGHLLIVRRALFNELGGLRSELDGSQDFDLALRATEGPRTVRHVPVIGYHWRRSPSSTASRYDQKPEAHAAAFRALEEAVARRGTPAKVERGLLESTFRVRRDVPPDTRLRVIIPIEGEGEDIVGCIKALATSDIGQVALELVLWDRAQPWTPEVRAAVRRAGQLADVAVAADPARTVDGDSPSSLWLFLHPSLRPHTPDWIAALVEHALRPEVGAVGARLVRPDGTLVHAGIVPGLIGRRLGPPFFGCPPGNAGYWGLSRMVRNWTAVSGECLMVRPSTLADHGGWATHLPQDVAGVDLCERVRQSGLLVVCTPFAELVVVGEPSADGLLPPEHPVAMEIARCDPYFNPNLDPAAVEFRLPPAPAGYNPSSGARNWPV